MSAEQDGQYAPCRKPLSIEGNSRLREFDLQALPGHRTQLGLDTPLQLDSGGRLGPYWLAWQSYGTLNKDKSNAVLVCHALTGDQFVAETHPVTGKPGWWEEVVGPGKVIDTNRYYVICANVLGGCMGSEGPGSINPATNKAWALDFPIITIHDMVRAQKALLDYLGIEKLFMVIGGSMGGMQALSLAALYPETVGACGVFAATARHSAQNIALGEVGRQAIMADPAWRDGNYDAEQAFPSAGLSVARMVGSITYLSMEELQTRFGRSLQDRHAVSFSFDADFQIESFLRYQGLTFVKRFDPNSYIYITRAMNYFDLAADCGNGNLAALFHKTPVKFLVVSFNRDWLYPTAESRALVQALSSAGADVSFAEIDSENGHDAFLLEEPEFHRQLAGFVKACEERAPGVRPMLPARQGSHRPANEHKLLAELVTTGSRVLDIGCSDGVLLQLLAEKKQVRGFGLELNRDLVQSAIAAGLPVIQGDANTDLATYADKAFDYAILNQTLSELRNPIEILQELRRISARLIVNVANFGHWRARLHYGIMGRSPVTKALPYAWYNSPNIRFCSLDDFRDLADAAGLTIERAIWLDSGGNVLPPWCSWHPNLLAARGLYILSSQPKPSN